MFAMKVLKELTVISYPTGAKYQIAMVMGHAIRMVNVNAITDGKENTVRRLTII